MLLRKNAARPCDSVREPDMKRARRGTSVHAATKSRSRPVDCRDVLSAVLALWPATHLFRFAVALDACLTAPVPAPPRPLTTKGLQPGACAAFSEAQCVWVIACNNAAEEARYARLLEIPVAVPEDEPDAPRAVSLAVFVRGLCARFDAHFRVGLFDDLDMLTPEEETARSAARLLEENTLVTETRACFALLFAGDVRIQRLIMFDAERFFACDPPMLERAQVFAKTCAKLRDAFCHSELTLEDLGHAVADAWLFG